MLLAFWNDEVAAIVSIEIILIITVAVLTLIVGWSEVAHAVNTGCGSLVYRKPER